MASIKRIARDFFDACEKGKGWQVCTAYCAPDATFSSQAEPLAEMRTLEEYVNWMRDLFNPLPNATYDLKAFAVDDERESVTGFAVFSATHTGEGGPVPATGKTAHADYVYVMDFEGDKIKHMTKIWNSGRTLRELGWA